MNRYILISIIILFLNIRCKAQKGLVKDEDDVYEIVNLQSSILDTHQVYYKSYVVEKSKLDLSNDVFKCKLNHPNFELAKEKTDSIAALDISKNRKKELKEQLAEKYIAVNISNEISEEGFKWMKENMTMKQLRWNQDLIKKKMSKTNIHHLVKFSVPVFNTKKDFAIMFLRFNNSLQANIYKKGDDTWIFYCYYSLTLWD